MCSARQSSSMRDDALFLHDIIAASSAIRDFVRDKERTHLETDRLLLAGVLHELATIGEAARRLSSTIGVRYPAVPWKRAIAMRNYIAHAYFALDLDVIWQTATTDVP